MKITEVEVDRQLESVSDNAVQANLRKALALLGPNGEGWCKYVQQNDRFQRCAIGAVSVIIHGIPFAADDCEEVNMLGKAAEKLGGRERYCSPNVRCLALTAAQFNNDAISFAQIRHMFHLAIELAA